MPDLPSPVASVVITSRNRKTDLLVAIGSCLSQTVPVEVLVYDDASTDGTTTAIHDKFPPARFPQVKVIRQEAPVGYIALRNRGARDAQTNVIISIDDDAIFTTPTIVETTLRGFNHPRVGAIAIPFKNVSISQDIFQRAPAGDDVYITSSYIGTAHAVRRDLFLQLGGYREEFVHQGEESDYCMRLLNAGYVVRLGDSDLIHHFVSPKRDMTRLHFYGSRNNILLVAANYPALQLPYALPRATGATLWHGWRVRALGIKLKAVAKGYLDSFRYLGHRRPVSSATLKLFKRLQRSPARLRDVEGQLPPVS
jgi:GT2 family glycosyltransferase